MNCREEYINNICIGNIVVFKKGDGVFVGKVLKIEEEALVIQMKNATIYYAEKKDIMWVKTGSRYPEGIYNALKFTKENLKNG